MARSKTQSRTLEGVDAEMEPATAAEAAQDQTLGGGDPTRRPWPDLCVTLFNEATRASLRPKSIALRLRIDGETSDLIRWLIYGCLSVGRWHLKRAKEHIHGS